MNNKKVEITNYVMSCLNITNHHSNFKNQLRLWWRDPRNHNRGGLLLTKQGLDDFYTANIKNYKIKLNQKLIFDNKLILGLTKFINSPFYITNKEIVVFDEKTAIQLILFNGDIKKFINAKFKRLNLD